MIKFAILGGGVAGLCAAIRLCELGEEPLVIEGGTYPSHKICGEFLSPECLPILERWKIDPIPISQIIVNCSKNKVVFPFPSDAGGLSHFKLDPALASFATSSGAVIKTETRVSSFLPKQRAQDPHMIHLSSGEVIEASHVVIATGRLPHDTKQPQMSYMGFKTHYDHLSVQPGTIEMFSLPGSYLGISPIEDDKYNVACLADMKKMKGEPLFFLKNIISQHPRLSTLLLERDNLFERWMMAPVPSFGIKKTPDWRDAYFIGDAAVTIPPACGNGLSMAILGGQLAAEYAVRCQADAFKKRWTKRCSAQVFWAKILHHLMLNPAASAPLSTLAIRFPFIAKKLFELTRNQEIN